MRLPSQMRGGGPRITSRRLTTGVMPSAHEVKTTTLATYYNLRNRGALGQQLCGPGEKFCPGEFNPRWETVTYICCPEGWKCDKQADGIPYCRLPDRLENWFKQKLGPGLFAQIMRRVNVIA
jgi:hypothetical protein